ERLGQPASESTSVAPPKKTPERVGKKLHMMSEISIRVFQPNDIQPVNLLAAIPAQVVAFDSNDFDRRDVPCAGGAGYEFPADPLLGRGLGRWNLEGRFQFHHQWAQ